MKTDRNTEMSLLNHDRLRYEEELQELETFFF